MPPLRQNDVYSASSQQALILASRIEAKKAELENLSQLRDLSNALAMKMEALETQLSTLKDGTEGISCVDSFVLMPL
jgi:DASH complex subunit DAD2